LLDRKLNLQTEALIKINNITSFLPLSIDEMLDAAKNELNKAFSPYKSQIKLQDGGNFVCSTIDKKHQCKVYNDQLPIIINADKRSHCCGVVQKECYSLCHVCIPLVAGTEVLGVITLKNPGEEKLSRANMEIIMAIGHQLAATLHRDRLINNLAEERDSLEKANKEICGLNEALRESIEELEKAQNQMILTERLAAAGQLAANLAHEINNPVGVISARLGLIFLEMGSSLSPELVKDLEIIKKHIERISHITRGLLTFTRPPIAETELVDLKPLVNETVDWFKRQFLRKGIEFKIKLPDSIVVEGNKEQLQQVLVNLIANAGDAMPRGGNIFIVCRNLPELKVNRLDIEDTGEGMTEETIAKLFDPFFSTKSRDLGTGLGLPVSLKIIGDHGGTINVSSELGKGSRFSIYFPYISIRE